MSFFEIIFTILIEPLRLIMEIVFSLSNKVVDSIGLSLIVMSVLSGIMSAMLVQMAFRKEKTSIVTAVISTFMFIWAAYVYIMDLQLLHGETLGFIRNLGAGGGLCGFALFLAVYVVTILVFFISGKCRVLQDIYRYVLLVVGIVLVIYSLFFYKTDHLRRRILLLGIGVLCLVPLVPVIYRVVKGKLSDSIPAGKVVKRLKALKFTNDWKLFAMSGLYLSVLLGMVIPSSVIRSSPQEFVDVSMYRSPNWYIFSAFCIAAGLFTVWFSVYYFALNENMRTVADIIMWIAVGTATIDYMFFGSNLGILNSNLKYLNEIVFTSRELIVNILMVGIVIIAMLLAYIYLRDSINQILLIALVTMFLMSVYNMFFISQNIAPLKEQSMTEVQKSISIPLSKDEKNVVVIMLDRGMGEYIPYIMEEKPELKEQFNGFTYYSNVISYGGHTNIGSPALYGGYEYTPEEMNKRDEEALVDKHNEALMLMPVIFDENGFEVTVCDQSYANYSYMCDQSIYDGYENINTFVTSKYFTDINRSRAQIKSKERNFFCYGVMRSLPLCVWMPIYDKGLYNETATVEASVNQTVSADFMTGDAEEAAFLTAYAVLNGLPEITDIHEDGKGTFLCMANDTAHETMLLQEPDYVPQSHVDNYAYEEENRARYTVDGVTLNMEEKDHYTFYQSNMAAMLQLGNWFDYLREQGVYDNTRIILVSDHGAPVYQIDSLIMPEGEKYTGEDTLVKDITEHYDVEYYYPLLMVKDFDSKDFVVSDEFMTNADVPTIAFDGIIDNPVNPFTGRKVDNKAKYTGEQHVLASGVWDILRNNGNKFVDGIWLSVKDDMRDIDNWKVYEH